MEICQDVLPYASVSGLHQRLQAFGISYQRARPYVHSPDEEYQAKEAFLHQVLRRRTSEECEVLFQDEFTLWAEAGVACDFALQGKQPLARLPLKQKDKRICGSMNAFTGEVSLKIDSKIGIAQFVEFLQQLVEQYPDAKVIYLIVDNCPIHFHPDVQAALCSQEHNFQLHLPPTWSKVKPRAQYIGMDLNIQMVPLPTYASWLNPIEKLWKLLKKEIWHLHPHADHFKELVEIVERWFEQFENPCPRLLRFCGLKNPDGIFADDFRAVEPHFF